MGKFSLPIGPDLPSIPNKFNIVLETFGLSNVKPLLYNISPEDQDVTDQPASLLGTPVYSNLIFEDTAYIDNAGKTITVKGMSIDTVLFDPLMDKQIIVTPLQGRNGKVKEYISDGDYEVIIRGALTSVEANVYPIQDVNSLIAICKAPVAIPVSSKFLQLFSIHNLVIHSYSFPQREGFNNMQIFELRCMSDEPIELSLNA